MNTPGQRDPASYSAQELADPRIDPATLRLIAAVRPDLWRQIHDHPNCDGELAEYIRNNASQSAPQQQAARPQAPQQTGPQRPQGAQPTGPQQPGQPGQPPSQASQGAQQMAAGAKDLANSAKTYFTNTVAPAAMSAAQTVGQKSGDATNTGGVHWSTWFRIAIPILALFGIFTLFMPLVTISAMGRSESFGFFSPEAPDDLQTEGVLLLFAFVLVIAFGVVSLVLGKAWAIITAGSLTVLIGTLAMFDGFVNANNVSSSPYASAGAGAIFLGITGLGLLASAIISFVPLIQKQLQKEQHPQFPQAQFPQQTQFQQQAPPQQQPQYPQQPQQQAPPQQPQGQQPPQPPAQ